MNTPYLRSNWESPPPFEGSFQTHQSPNQGTFNPQSFGEEQAHQFPDMEGWADVINTRIAEKCYSDPLAACNTAR